jgi:hypothetical protein
MARSDRDPTPEVPESGSGAWLAAYSARFAKTAEDTMRVGTAAADRWARRSLEEGEWSVDTVTADVIADWEEMTPLLGRWLDLWLEAVQQGIRAGAPTDPTVAEAPGDEAPGDEAPGDGAPGDGEPDVPRMMLRRAQEYGALWEGAAAKLRDSSYRSEDLLDDWFRFWGKAVRDMTAGSALLWGAGAGTTSQRSERPQEDQGHGTER